MTLTHWQRVNYAPVAPHEKESLFWNVSDKNRIQNLTEKPQLIWKINVWRGCFLQRDQRHWCWWVCNKQLDLWLKLGGNLNLASLLLYPVKSKCAWRQNSSRSRTTSDSSLYLSSWSSWPSFDFGTSSAQEMLLKKWIKKTCFLRTIQTEKKKKIISPSQ